MKRMLTVLLTGFTVAVVWCGGMSEAQKLTVPVRIEAKLERVSTAQGRGASAIASVWLKRPVEQKLQYDPKTRTAIGVANVEPGRHTFRVEARRADGVTLYAGEEQSNVTAEEQSKQVKITLLPATTPSIRLTHVPRLGSFGYLEGVVENVNPAEVAVAVYIQVDGQWWTKPYWDYPKTPVRGDGKWTCDITTGGHDEDATKIRAYLIRKGYNPPLAPDQGLPPNPPTPDVLAMVEVVRK